MDREKVTGRGIIPNGRPLKVVGEAVKEELIDELFMIANIVFELPTGCSEVAVLFLCLAVRMVKDALIVSHHVRHTTLVSAQACEGQPVSGDLLSSASAEELHR